MKTQNREHVNEAGQMTPEKGKNFAMQPSSSAPIMFLVLFVLGPFLLLRLGALLAHQLALFPTLLQLKCKFLLPHAHVFDALRIL